MKLGLPMAAEGRTSCNSGVRTRPANLALTEKRSKRNREPGEEGQRLERSVIAKRSRRNASRPQGWTLRVKRELVEQL